MSLSKELMSHPVRVRGLKHGRLNTTFFPKFVAPRAGAWIETWKLCLFAHILRVAPRAGAWIETYGCTKVICIIIVAPRAGAWIETTSMKSPIQRQAVAPRAGAWIETKYFGEF